MADGDLEVVTRSITIDYRAPADTALVQVLANLFLVATFDSITPQIVDVTGNNNVKKIELTFSSRRIV